MRIVIGTFRGRDSSGQGTDPRTVCLKSARELRWPTLRIRRDLIIGGGELGWQRFVAFATLADIVEAGLALDPHVLRRRQCSSN
jgi:hypothetical protein